MVKRFADSRTRAFTVTVHTLDYFDSEPDLIKMDAEGAELSVLRGARKALSKAKKVIVEIHDSPVLPGVRKFLEEYSFTLRDLKIPKHPAYRHVIGQKIG